MISDWIAVAIARSILDSTYVIPRILGRSDTLCLFFPPTVPDFDRREHFGVKEDVVFFVLNLKDRRAVLVIAAVSVVPLMCASDGAA